VSEHASPLAAPGGTDAGGQNVYVARLTEELVRRGHEVTVYCRHSNGNPEQDPREYLGMKLVFLPALRKRALETLSHTGLSVTHLIARQPRRRSDAAIVFNAANAPFLPLIRAAGIPVATHVDGLEWKRAKWGPAGQKYYLRMEALAVRCSDLLIADAIGIQEYYREKFDADTVYLAYGAPIQSGEESAKLAELGLEPRGYHLVVARFEPENHVHVIVDGYVRSAARTPLVVVGSAPYSDEYTRSVHALGDDRVRFVGGVWDQELLDQLYANARIYWHGHSVGGTNPSLLRAIGSGTATNAYDVGFNREVLSTAGRYFSSPDEVAALAEDAERGEGLAERGELARAFARRYDWDKVADGYELLCLDLAARRGRRSNPKPARVKHGTARVMR